jgi:hypothetical protein
MTADKELKDVWKEMSFFPFKILFHHFHRELRKINIVHRPCVYRRAVQGSGVTVGTILNLGFR